MPFPNSKSQHVTYSLLNHKFPSANLPSAKPRRPDTLQTSLLPTLSSQTTIPKPSIDTSSILNHRSHKFKCRADQLLIKATMLSEDGVLRQKSGRSVLKVKEIRGGDRLRDGRVAKCWLKTSLGARRPLNWHHSSDFHLTGCDIRVEQLPPVMCSDEHSVRNRKEQSVRKRRSRW